MMLKLSSNTCSLCEDTDVSLSETDTKQYIRFITEAIGKDNWENSKKFRVCLLCTHSLDLLKDVITGIENHGLKSCFSCKSTVNLFKHNDLPENHKSNVTAFATTFNLRGLNMCLHCFYAVNFWVKLKSYLKSSQQLQTLDRSSRSSSAQTSENAVVGSSTKTRSKVSKSININFAMPRDAFKIPGIMSQVKIIKMLQNKMNKVTRRKFSSDKKLVERIPFVFLTRVPQRKVETSIIEVSDDTSDGKFTPSIRLRNLRNRLDVDSGKGKKSNRKTKSPVQRQLRNAATEESSDSDDQSTTTVRKFKNKPLKIIVSPLKNKVLIPFMKGDVSFTNGNDKSAISKNKNGRKKIVPPSSPKKKKKKKRERKFLPVYSDESDDNNYSVSSSGSTTGIVIKRISRNSTSTPGKALRPKLVSSPLRSIRIQSKKGDSSSSSEKTDSSPPVSTPRSPVTLPPKKNRKRIMDLSDTDYFETSPTEKRSSRATKEEKQDDVEEVIITTPESNSGRTKRSRAKGRKALIDTLDISSDESSQEETNLDDGGEGNRKDLSNKEKSETESPEENEESSNTAKGKRLKPNYKRMFDSEDSTDNFSFLDSQKIADKTNHDQLENDNHESQPTVEKIVSTYLDVDKSASQHESILNEASQSKTATLIGSGKNENVDNTTSGESISKENDNVQNPANDLNETNKLDDINIETTDKELSSPDAEQINFERSLISPPVDTLDLLTCINDDVANKGDDKKIEDLLEEDQLNLQLTPDGPKDATASDDTQPILLISNDDDNPNGNNIFTVETQITDEDVTTKLTSQDSNYQDAVSTEQVKDVVTILEDISFTTSPTPKRDSIEETLHAIHLETDTFNSLITEDGSDIDNVTTNKRKRNSDNDSADLQEVTVSDADDTPRTKRVRFASEKKVLNEDDTVCLEDFEANEDLYEETIASDKSEDTASVAADGSETLCSLDM